MYRVYSLPPPPPPPPQKKKEGNCINIVFSFSWDGYNTHVTQKLETMVVHKMHYGLYEGFLPGLLKRDMEQLASHARRSPKEICGAACYHRSQTISARISSTAKIFAEDSEKHGRLTGKTRISVCELWPMKILTPVRLMGKTQSSAKRKRRAWSAGRGGERKHCAGEK